MGSKKATITNPILQWMDYLNTAKNRLLKMCIIDMTIYCIFIIVYFILSLIICDIKGTVKLC